MKKNMVVFCGMMLAASVVQGADKDGFWDKMQNRLEKVTPAKKTSTTTAVGGVRGAKNDDAADIYWKGKDKPVEAPDEELQKFNSGVEAKLRGDNELALKQFEEFLAAYPNSSLRLDSLQAAERIRNEIAAAKHPKVEPVALLHRQFL
jgi:TolA-binding protein